MADMAASAEVPALAALRDYPLLLEPVAASVAQQAAHALVHSRQFTGRTPTLTRLRELTASLEGGLIALEGPAGSGVTSLLGHLATTQPWACWFGEADARQGAAALAAQILALHGLSVPLIPPTVASDPAALADLLAEAGAQAVSDAPVVVLIDPPSLAPQPRSALPVLTPAPIPRGVFLIYGCLPGADLPGEPVARVALPLAGAEVEADQAHILQGLGCPTDWHAPIIAAAQGNMLYLRLATGLLQQGLLAGSGLAPGLDGLHSAWWASLEKPGRRLAMLLAAADEPLPLDLCAELAEADPAPLLAAWSTMGIVPPHAGARCHPATRDFLARAHSVALAQAHATLASLAARTLDIDGAPSTTDRTTYLARQFARHAALASEETRTATLPLVAQRRWVRMQERRTQSLADAAHDMAWELQQAAQQGPVLRLVRSAALTGTLISSARTMPPDAAVAGLHTAVQQRGREAGLKPIRALVDQLPDGQPKALVLRRLGEACYGLQMRTAAMRLLSQALDIEAQKEPDAWREQREQLLTDLAAAALDLDAVEVALDVGARIGHTERHAMVETQVVRWLLAHGDLVRAQEVARGILHESLGAWALAEVAVKLARTGDLAGAEALLTEVPSETACAWAEIELACDDAAHDERRARQRIDQLGSPNLHDRGLAQLARALALAAKDGDALDAAVQISDVAVRVSALLDLRLTLEGLVAMLALEEATAVIDKLPRDMRVPLISLLAAAYAALGRRDAAFGVAQQLAAGEEQERALSRVAVAFGQQGDTAEALAIARALQDDDERDWTFDELAHMLAEAGHWADAWDLAGDMTNTEQRAHTQADIAIARARAGDPLDALQMAGAVPLLAEYARALNLIAPLLVAAGATQVALTRVPGAVAAPDAPAHTLRPNQVSRYLATIATALAHTGDLDQARVVARSIPLPLDQARAHLAMAQTAVLQSDATALAELGNALHVALTGRDAAFRVLDQAVPLFATLGGAALLQEIAAAIDEIDSL